MAAYNCKTCEMAMDRHCPSPTCTWWKCRNCKVTFDSNKIIWKPDA